MIRSQIHTHRSAEHSLKDDGNSFFCSYDNIDYLDKVKGEMNPITEWKWTIYGDHRIYWAKDGVDFDTASAFCEGEGGRLPRIMSQGEEKEVKVIFENNLILTLK